MSVHNWRTVKGDESIACAVAYGKISQEAQSEYDTNRKSAVGTGDRSEHHYRTTSHKTVLQTP